MCDARASATHHCVGIGPRIVAHMPSWSSTSWDPRIRDPGGPGAAGRRRRPRGEESLGHLPRAHRRNVLESYHDAPTTRRNAPAFTLGHLSLDSGAGREHLLEHLPQGDEAGRGGGRIPGGAGAPEKRSRHLLPELLGLPVVPDSWASTALPIMPIHRSTEATRRAVLATSLRFGRQDDRFIDRRDVRDVLSSIPQTESINIGSSWWAPTRKSSATCTTLRRHERRASAHRRRGGYFIDHVQQGDTVTEVLHYVSTSATTRPAPASLGEAASACGAASPRRVAHLLRLMRKGRRLPTRGE